MSKYKPLTDPITRSEASLILDLKRFDRAVRNERLVPLGKLTGDTVVPAATGPLTSPLVFAQSDVRMVADLLSKDLAEEARTYREQAKEFKKMKPPLTRRQIALIIGKKLTGVLIRGGRLAPYGKLTDTKTAAHTYDPIDVSVVLNSLYEETLEDAKAVGRGARTRIPA